MLSLTEVMVSVGVFSVFMSVCTGSMVQYQNALGHVGRMMNYSQNMQIAMSYVTRELGDSNLKTFVDAEGNPLSFPASSVFFRLPTDTNIHGDHIFGNLIGIHLNAEHQIVRTDYSGDTADPNTLISSKVLTNHVETLVFDRVYLDDEPMPNALAISITSTDVSRTGRLTGTPAGSLNPGANGIDGGPGIDGQSMNLGSDGIDLGDIVNSPSQISATDDKPSPGSSEKTSVSTSTIVYLAN